MCERARSGTGNGAASGRNICYDAGHCTPAHSLFPHWWGRNAQGKPTVLLFHAELDGPVNDPGKGDPTDYDTFLKSRPESFETGKPYAVPTPCAHMNEQKILCGVTRANKSNAFLTF